jgi:hypothetical protein
MRDYLVWEQPSCQEQTVRMQNPRFVIPAWSAGIQIDMDVSGGILANLMAAIHAGMKEVCIFILRGRA